MANIKFKLANNSTFSNNFAAMLLGKSGFQTTFGGVSLLANTVSVVDSDPANRPNGNIQFTVVGFDQLHDYNFDKHLLAVNDVSGSVQGDDYITVPVNDKSLDISPDNFVGALPIATELSYNIAGYNVHLNTVKIVNAHAGDNTLFDKLEEPPFYVSFTQLINKDHLKGVTTTSTSRTGWNPNTAKAGNVYILGSTRTRILENNVSTFTEIKNLPLGVEVKAKKFIKFYVDGIRVDNSEFSFNPTSNTITYDFGSVVGAQQRTRTEATYYTVPAIERGDNVTLFSGNTYSVSNVSYDPTYPTDYNARITANTVYRITLGQDLRANVGGRILTNITNDPNGLIGNVDYVANTATFDYNATTYPGNWNLANNQIYQIGSRLEFEEYFFGQPSRKIIPNVPFGLNSVRARNKNSAGLHSPYTTQSIIIRQIPIQKVTNLTITESLYLDTTRGISTRATVSFDIIENQGVTDYEISYRLSGIQKIGESEVNQLAPLTSFNTVKVNHAGAQDGKISYTIPLIERVVKNTVSLFVRVTPLNRDFRGTPLEIEKVIQGKDGSPQNISSFIVGQNDNNLVFNWQYPTKADGTLIDLDLEGVEIRRAGSAVNTNDPDALATAFNSAPQLAFIAPPSTNVIVPIPNYGLSTYIIQTIDTSGNRSASHLGFQFAAVRPPDLNVYKAFSEGDPGTPFAKNSIGEDITNSNAGEANYPSLASTLRDGLVYADKLLRAGVTTAQTPSTHTDNANGSASGWSTTADTDDIIATDVAAEYVTQIRDVGSNVTGKIVMNVFSEITTVDTWTGSRLGDVLVSGTSEPTGATGGPGVAGKARQNASVLTDKVVALGSGGSITGATQGDPVVITSAGYDKDNVVRVSISGVGGMTQLNGNDYFIKANATDSFAIYHNNTFTSAVDGSSFGVYTSGGTFTVPIGIGTFLFNNLISSAETIAFDNFITKSLTSTSTDITGSVSTLVGAKTFSGNVYAIWNNSSNPSDANSFALIANVINAVAIQLGNVYHVRKSAVGSRYFLTPNAMPNVTQNAATYQIVNLSQFLDVPAKAFRGDPTVITQNIDFRFSTSNVWLAANNAAFVTPNGNVKTNSFVNFNVASGFMTVQTSDQKFRWFQARLQVTNQNPTENDYLLDALNYTIDLKDKVFKQTKNIIPTLGPTTDAGKDGIGFNYIASDFKQNPLVTATISNTRVALVAVVSNVTLQYANVNLYFAANGAIVNSQNYPGKDKATAADQLLTVGKVTIEATGV